MKEVRTTKYEYDGQGRVVKMVDTFEKFEDDTGKSDTQEFYLSGAAILREEIDLKS